MIGCIYNRLSKESIVSILQQIKSDIEILKTEIVKAINEATTGEQLEKVVFMNTYKQAQLKRLTLIIESGIIPNEYYSSISKKKYYPSPAELILRPQIIPLVKHSFFCAKNSRKKTGLPESSIKILADDSSTVLSFFLEHDGNKKYPRGSYAVVKKGFSNAPTAKLRWAVKIYRESVMGLSDETHEMRVAMRAAYCYKQLGREGFVFRRNDKQYLVSNWLTGACLVDLDAKTIASIPMSRRIVMAISLLRELNILHKQGLIHNDIKPDNIMIDHGKLNLVDLDSVRPIHEMPLWGLTPIYSKRYLASAQLNFDAEYNKKELYLKFNKKTDIAALGWSLIVLFPEIYLLKSKRKTVEIEAGLHFSYEGFSLGHGPKYKDYPELQKLLKSMTLYNHEDQKFSHEYIEMLYEILPNHFDYKLYLKEDRLIGLGDALSSEDGVKAFRDIEIELLGYSQRVETVNGKCRAQ